VPPSSQEWWKAGRFAPHGLPISSKKVENRNEKSDPGEGKQEKIPQDSDLTKIGTYPHVYKRQGVLKWGCGL